MTLFRQEVIEAGRRRLWGEVSLSQPASLTVWTLVMALICLAVLMGLIFGTHVRKETVRGYLLPEGGIVNITPSRGGRITRILVREGDHVPAGMPLVEFSGESVGVETGQVLEAQILQIDQQIDSARRGRTASQTSLASEGRRLRDQIQANRVSQGLLQQRVGDKRALLAMLEDELTRYEALGAQGYASQIQINQRRQQLLAHRDDLNSLESQLAATQAGAADLATQLAGQRSAAMGLTAASDTEISLLEQKRIELSAAKGFVERAPVAGVVSNLQAETGQAAAGNMPIVSLMPDGSALQAELLVPSRAAGFLRPGHVARLQVDAYPFERFGMVTGRVLSVSKSVVKPNEFLAPIEIKEAVYRVRITLDRDFVLAYGARHALRPGMALTADIVIDKKPMWAQLFDPLAAAARRSQ